MFPRILPFALYIAFLAVEGVLKDHFPDFDARWLYPTKVGVVALALVVLWRRYVELRDTHTTLRQYALAVLAGVLVFVLWINLDAGWMLVGEFGKGYVPLHPDGSPDVVLIAFRLAGAALVVPVMEELFWRSFIQRWVQHQDFLKLDPGSVGVKALLIASALFAVEHQQWLAGLIAGLVYGGLYLQTRNLWVPIIAHAVTNGLLGVYVLMSGRWEFW